MPIPSPDKDEQRDAFVSRCMADPVMRREFPEADQRAAVCHGAWRKAHGGEKPKERA